MAQAVQPSLTRQLFNMASQYHDVVDLTLGDPDLKPSQSIRDAACAAIQAGKTRYSANAGLVDLRNAIAACVSAEYGMDVDPSSDIIVTVGGMESLFLTMAATLDPGDEVIIFAPYYVNYVQMVRMCGATPVFVETDPSKEESFSLADLEAAVSDKTVALVVNSPCNPTGRVMRSAELDAIAKVAREHDLLVVSDEVYKTLLYDNRTHDSILYREGMRERTVLIDSISKRFAMTGYRLGFAVGPTDVIANMTKMQENVAACAALPSQYAAIEAYTNCLSETRIAEEFEKRRDFICEGLSAIPGLEFVRPDATFYVFVDISSTGLDCVDFAYKLLESQHVAVVPGVAYGENYTSYVRIAFTHDVSVLHLAIERIAAFLDELKAEEAPAR